ALTHWLPGPRAWPWLVLSGLLFGLAALARPVVLAFLPFLILWFVAVVSSQWSVVSGQRVAITYQVSRITYHALRPTLLVVLAFGVAISPWTFYNYRAYGRFLLLDTANVTAFWHYNNFRGTNEDAALAAFPNP